MTTDFEKRDHTIVEAKESKVTLADLEVELTYASFNKPKTYKIFPCDDGKWGLVRADEWVPANSMACVGKVSAIIGNVSNRMIENPDDTIFLQVKGSMGAQNLVYHLEHS